MADHVRASSLWFVMAGLDPAISSKALEGDARVRPAHDEW